MDAGAARARSPPADRTAISRCLFRCPSPRSGVLLFWRLCMCTRPAPSWRSVPASARALGLSLLAVVHAAAVLLLAILGAPVRRLWPSSRRQRPATLEHVEVQIHLGDPACIAELEAIVWKTLARAERTWAPLPLPVDRVVVGAGFPAGGRADVYDDFLAMAEGALPGGPPRQPQR